RLIIHVNAPQQVIDPTHTPRGLSPIIALSARGRCPLSGPFWGEGDIELGGAGSDQFFGRHGNDIIDGASELRVRILVRNAAGAVLGLTDLMENRYQRDGNGNLIGNTLQQD